MNGFARFNKVQTAPNFRGRRPTSRASLRLLQGVRRKSTLPKNFNFMEMLQRTGVNSSNRLRFIELQGDWMKSLQKIQSCTLLHIIGVEAIDLINTFKWDNCSKECDSKIDFHSYDCIIKKLECHCMLSKNLTFERHTYILYAESRSW